MARLAAALLALVLQASPDAALVARTRTLVEALFAGRPGDIAALFDTRLRQVLPAAQLGDSVVTLTQQLGTFTGVRSDRVVARDGQRVVVLTCAFANGAADVQVAWNEASQIAGMNIQPARSVSAYTPPAYVTAARFTETAVTIDAGSGFPLPGTLAMPTGDGPFPGVVLVHGSGPGDRDESIGPNRPFRDLAWGLASRGIAVLRYDKRTRVHGARIAAIPLFTVKDETVDDAVAAAALLRRTAKVRGDRVFVAGHSLGGMLAPRIGAADPALGGLIVLAGPTRSLAEAVVAQLTHMAGLDGTITPAERAQITEAEAAVARAQTLEPGDPPLGGLLGQLPSSYLIDLRGYDPPAAARALRLPMLILQGERDYQVTLPEFAAWRAALEGRADVRAISYPALNHLFIAGTGAASPAEYLVEGHVDAAVVRDIADWVLAR